jgi:hypothetical protein
LRKLYNQRHDTGKRLALKLAQRRRSRTPVGEVSQPTVQPAAGEAPFTFVSATTALQPLRPPVPAALQPQSMPPRAPPAQGYASAPATILPNPTPPDDQAHGEASAVASVSPDRAAFMAWSADAVTKTQPDPDSEPSPPSPPSPPALNPFGFDPNFQKTLNNLPVCKDAKYRAKQDLAALTAAAKRRKVDGKNDVGASAAVGAVLQKRKADAQPSAQPSTKKNKAASQPSEEQPSKKKRKAAQPTAQGAAPRRAKQPRATTTKQPALLTVRRALNTFQIYIVDLYRFVFKRT